MASRPHSFGRKNDFSHSMWDDSGFNERHNLHSPLEDHSPKRRRDPREGTSDPLESRSDPLDLDTTQLYLNVTALQRSCKKLNKLRKELERKKKSKSQKEKKQKVYLEDSKDFKQKKDAYRDLYNEILVERTAVESLFDTSGHPSNDNQNRKQIASERQKRKWRPYLTQMDAEGCENCHQKETMIWKLEADIAKAQNDVKDSQHRIADLESQIARERFDKEDALRRLSSMASAKLRDNNPNIADLSDPNRPTKIAEMLSEIYDNEWTDAFDILEKYYKEEDNVQLLLNVLVEAHEQCNNLSGNILNNLIAPMKPTEIPSAISKNLKDVVKALAPYRMTAITKDIKSNLNSRFKGESRKAFDIYVDKCVDVCLYMSVQDPPMYLSADPSKDGLFSQASYRAYTKSGKYEMFIVWPVLYLHKDGPMMAKGVAQGTDDYTRLKNNYTQKYHQPVQSQYVPRRQNDYQHRPQQHQQQDDWNQYHGMQTTYGPQANLRHSQYPSSYRGQGYSKHQFNKTYNPRISSQTTDL